MIRTIEIPNGLFYERLSSSIEYDYKQDYLLAESRLVKNERGHELSSPAPSAPLYK